MTHEFITHLKRVRSSSSIRNLGKLLQVGLVTAVIYLLFHKTMEIGWEDVRSSMPLSPWFYCFFILWYLAPPFTEWLVYQLLWGSRVKPHFPVFLRMRVYNLAVMSYTGEAFIALWGKKSLGLKGKKAASSVKDSNILSALSSNLLTLSLLFLFSLSGELHAITNTQADFSLYVGLAAGFGLIIVPLVLVFQKKILRISGTLRNQILALHTIRLIVTLGLQVCLWSFAIPEAPLENWLLLITAQLVLTRIPFLPNTDLMFAGIGVSLMTFIEGPEAQLAGMFLTLGALSSMANIAAYFIAQLHGLKTRRATEVSA